MDKVIIAPPQKKFPVIKAQGRKVIVELEDELLPNTTYTIDFTDAIVDNNEGNALENFSYSFSTGDHIDTLAVSGTVLKAENLEPAQGIYVGFTPISTTQHLQNFHSKEYLEQTLVASLPSRVLQKEI